MRTVADEHFVALGQRGLREHLDAWERSTRAQHGPEVPWVARFSLFSRRAIGSHFAVSWEILRTGLSAPCNYRPARYCKRNPPRLAFCHAEL